jgi:Domain of unknown function (DUF1707)
MCHSRRYERPVERVFAQDPSRSDPTLRVSDDEREAVATLLRGHAGEGRLDLDELEQRLGAAYAATTRGDLDRLLEDLPSTRPASPRPAVRRHGALHGWSAFLRVGVLLLAIWAISGFGYFWPAWVLVWWGLALAMKSGPRLLRPGGQRIQAGS